MLSCMSKYRFVRVRISLLTSKIISGTWRLILEASQVQIGRLHLGMLSCMSKYRFVGVRILILISKVMSGTRRPLEADPGGLQWSHLVKLHICINIDLFGSGSKFYIKFFSCTWRLILASQIQMKRSHLDMP